jgi:ATP-dependent DNA helicase RecQ
MTPEDYHLQNALDNWREKTTEEHYGKAHLWDIGPMLVMPTEVLERIVDCTHYSKINSLEDMRKETRWDEVDKWGHDIVDLIQRLRPPQPALPPPMTTAPKQPVTALIRLPFSNGISSNYLQASLPAANPPQKERAKTKCGSCGLAGHNGKYSLKIL